MSPRPSPIVLALFAFILAVALGVGAQPASAQPANGVSPIGAFRDWYTFQYQEEGSPVCFMVTRPTRSEGDYTRRGEVFMMVTHRPGRNSRDVVSILTGYTYREGSEATIAVDGGQPFTLFTEGENAWAYDSQTDQAAIAAMKAGTRAVVRGTSSRGTLTTDTFSLLGFTAAYEAITGACGLPSA